MFHLNNVLIQSSIARSTAAQIVLMLMAGTLVAETSTENPRPNIVFIMTDDQGYWDTGATGNADIDTVHIDRLAKQGTQLRRYYAAPVCAPTRAGIMTGRYYLRTGLYNTRLGGDSMGLGEITLPQLLQQAGYRTGLFGKWHLGKYPDYQPQNRGFDEFFGHYHGHLERYHFPDQVYHNGTPVEARGYVTNLFTDAAIDFIEATRQQGIQPFFCALMYNAPHSPFLLETSHYQQPKGDKLLSKYLARGLAMREARIYALIERVDDNLGRLLASIEQQGIERETIVVFTSDNGGVSKHFKAGLNGNKASVYEGGVRAPCFVRWPGKIHAGRAVDALTSHVDWLPTFCELAGGEPPGDRPIDGKSMVKLLTNSQTTRHHQYVYHTWDRYHPNPDSRWAISDGKWKLLSQVRTGAKATRSQWRLFNVDDDPGETSNLAKRYPDQVDRLRTEFVRWFDDVTKGQQYRPIPIPIDGQPIRIGPSWGEIEGANIESIFDGYDWDTIEGWSQPGERVRFRVDVKTPGRYQVKLGYGCKPTDAGGKLLIIAGQQTPQPQSLEHTVRPTATADQFGIFDVGSIQLNADVTAIDLVVKECEGTELMRLNHLTFVPLKPERAAD
ncbi:arylsulfatase [Roseiconus lacunae]|uniref:arylsulfatase n=1 Tax=Roseiconus lacunae TaxID=2605694 RepID=UPI001E5809F5|nr:arylsulfatase [Roseiconus lacunae]MCD0463234.1 arylsulfatase [Roseiconus lacunae]